MAESLAARRRTRSRRWYGYAKRGRRPRPAHVPLAVRAHSHAQRTSALADSRTPAARRGGAAGGGAPAASDEQDMRRLLLASGARRELRRDAALASSPSAHQKTIAACRVHSLRARDLRVDAAEAERSERQGASTTRAEGSQARDAFRRAWRRGTQWQTRCRCGARRRRRSAAQATPTCADTGAARVARRRPLRVRLRQDMRAARAVVDPPALAALAIARSFDRDISKLRYCREILRSAAPREPDRRRPRARVTRL